MNKKITLCALGLISAMTLVGCGNKTTDGQKVLDAFNKINEVAGALNQKTTVTKGNMVIASEEVNYNFVTGKKVTTTKTLNPSTADTAWNVKTAEEDFSLTNKDFGFKETSFSTVTLIDNTLIGIISNESVLTLLGVESSTVKGDVTLNIKIDNLETLTIESVNLNYTSVNDNLVVIDLDYTI